MNIYKVWIFYDSDFILCNNTIYGFLSQIYIKIILNWLNYKKSWHEEQMKIQTVMSIMWQQI